MDERMERSIRPRGRKSRLYGRRRISRKEDYFLHREDGFLVCEIGGKYRYKQLSTNGNDKGKGVKEG